MKACVFTLGCKMNEVESESLMRGLEALGYETTEQLSRADLYLINTCAVTAEAERKSRQAVTRVRKFNKDAPVVVFGCAAQNDPQSFLARDGVLFVAGAQGKERVLQLLAENARGAHCEESAAFSELPAPKQTKTRAFLRIQDGCNRFCSYCLIPYLRGRTRSRSAQSVLEEAMQSGAKEIVLTGIDITSYRDGDIDLAGLLTMLKGVPARIRLGSLEPMIVTPAFLQAAKDAGNVAPHFHLSLQSGSTAVLKRMNRHYTREEYLSACALIYSYFEDAAITTDIIAGFPTEREEDFMQSLSIIEEAGFSRIHAFPFSPRRGTNAAKLPDLPLALKKERTQKLIEAGRAQEERYLARFVGREAEVLFEEEGGYTANYIRVRAAGAREGSLCKVKLVSAEQGGMFAEIIKEI